MQAMNVLQRPRDREFCGTMQDYVIDTEVSITFAVEYGGKRILDEDYVPDADYLVRIRKLGKFCENALWSIWCAGEISWQNSSAGFFIFFIATHCHTSVHNLLYTSLPVLFLPLVSSAIFL